MNIQWRKQLRYTWSCSWNPHFLVFFWYFWKDKSTYCKFTYISESRSSSSMEGDEGGTFSKAADWKPLFLLNKIKNKTQAAQIRYIMHSSSIHSNPLWVENGEETTSKYIHQNIRAYSRNKRNLHWLVIWEYCILGRIQAKGDVDKQVLFVPNRVGGRRGVATPGTLCNFYPHLSLKTVFPALKLTQNC